LWIAFHGQKWYSVSMNDRERLEQIIDLETPVAEAGCLTAQSLVINAMSELVDILDREIALRRDAQFDEACLQADIRSDD
jgi:hypothetical protein